MGDLELIKVFGNGKFRHNFVWNRQYFNINLHVTQVLGEK